MLHTLRCCCWPSSNPKAVAVELTSVLHSCNIICPQAILLYRESMDLQIFRGICFRSDILPGRDWYLCQRLGVTWRGHKVKSPTLRKTKAAMHSQDFYIPHRRCFHHTKNICLTNVRVRPRLPIRVLLDGIAVNSSYPDALLDRSKHLWWCLIADRLYTLRHRLQNPT